jgi:hypothetical protein
MEWNIHGLNNIQKLDKKQWEFLFNCEIIGLLETWHTAEIPSRTILEKNFYIFDSPATKEKSKGRPSGGIINSINQ